jgi:hypothetical protein
MSDLRSRLERIGERVRVAPDAFERLDRARRRRERNRRITAGAVALLVAIAGTVAAFTAFRTSDGGQPIADGGQDGFFALWPEQTAEGLAAAQAAVDADDPDLGWRSDPNEIARRFALDILLWPAADVTVVGEKLDLGDLNIDVEIPSGQSCDELIADATCPASKTTLIMRRLGDPNGLWSIVRVSSDDLALPLAPGAEMSSGDQIVVPTSLPEGTGVSTGVAFLTECDRAGFNEDVEVRDGALTITVPQVPDGCQGYVYAMTPKTGVGGVAIGSFLLTDAAEVPAVGYLVNEIAAVPVLFTNPVPTAPSTVAEFTCDATGTISPSSLAVHAQPDGVHVAVTNLADERISFTVGGSESTMYVVGDGGADPGERKEIVLGLPPGDADVSCVLGSKGGIDTSPIADLRVADPTGSYVPIGMDCPMSSQAPDDATSFRGDLVEVARQHLSGLEFDDVVERVGYPSGDEPVVRVVRNGNVVALATFQDDAQGGWLVDTVVTCVNVLIGWSQEVTGVSGPIGSPATTTAWDQLCSAARENGIYEGNEVHITGEDTRFDTRCLIAPAGERLTVLFSNLDAGVRRNLSIYELTPFLRECIVTGTAPSRDVDHPLSRGELVEGVDEILYDVAPLEPGEYYFQDDEHPSANGVLVVE